ncbi:MAG: B-box zinc finger protein [Anaerolineales bacterium]|nr:B-box zinc finger protein [Anaerolineales bacterium]
MTESALVCANHPDRPTTLRCNRCEKPICTKCAVLTPVGYRCKECVRGQQAVFETATPLDFVLAFVIAALGTAMATGILNLIGFWGIFVAPLVGGALAEAIRFAVRRRRGLRLPLTAAVGAIVGVLLNLVIPVFNAILMFTSNVGLNLLAGIGLQLIWPLVYGGLIASTLYYRLRGIRM